MELKGRRRHEAGRQGRADDNPEDVRRALKPFGVTEREAQVAWLLSWQHTDKEIADVLGISPSTAQKHVVSIRRKLGADDRRVAGSRIRIKVRAWRNSVGLDPPTGTP